MFMVKKYKKYFVLCKTLSIRPVNSMARQLGLRWGLGLGVDSWTAFEEWIEIRFRLEPGTGTGGGVPGTHSVFNLQ